MKTISTNHADNGQPKQKFREKRFLFFTGLLARLTSTEPVTILDIGGTEKYWIKMSHLYDSSKVKITVLNRTEVNTQSEHIDSVKGDACDLSAYADNQFDIVYSNSVIEHLFKAENQQKMANEARRVGKNYYIQTPNYYFPIEPHWYLPFFQFMPFGIKVLLTRINFRHRRANNNADAIQKVKEVILLTEKEMKSLFPDGKVYREKAWGMVKSITLYRFQGE